jgi:hypothetical protein
VPKSRQGWLDGASASLDGQLQQFSEVIFGLRHVSREHGINAVPRG